MLVGKQSWQFTNQPVIISTGVIGGPFEKQGAMADYFDEFGEDIWFNQPSFEQAQKQLFEEAVQNEKLFSELAVDWAVQTHPFSLEGYKEFQLFRDRFSN